MRVALTRDVPGSINECELTHLDRQPIDVALARRQHRQYEEALETLSCFVVRLPTENTMPDSVFVEDAAVVLDEVGVICRPGAESRRLEVASLAIVLSKYRPLARIDAPGTLDGGDVLRIGRKLFVGRSERTNDEGIRQLYSLIGRFGYDVVPTDFRGCLHLKSAVTAVAENRLLLNPEWVEPQVFGTGEWIEVDPNEPAAANVLSEGGTVLISSSYPRTRERLLAQHLSTRTVDASELQKAEAGLTCCSVIFESTLPATPRVHGGR